MVQVIDEMVDLVLELLDPNIMGKTFSKGHRLGAFKVAIIGTILHCIFVPI